MGSAKRPKPQRLAEKLKLIRENLNLSQVEIVERLHPEVTGISQNILTNIELGKREPNLLLLLEYARLAGVSVDMLIDDEVDLPKIKRNLS